jgi:hypothetical protein
MQDLEKMAAKLWETARKLPPGTEQHALLETKLGHSAPN